LHSKERKFIPYFENERLTEINIDLKRRHNKLVNELNIIKTKYDAVDVYLLYRMNATN